MFRYNSSGIKSFNLLLNMFFFSTRLFNPQCFTGGEYKEYVLLKRVERAQFHLTLVETHPEKCTDDELSLRNWWRRELENSITSALGYSPRGSLLIGSCERLKTSVTVATYFVVISELAVE